MIRQSAEQVVAGRELDALVAEKVMGAVWRPVDEVGLNPPGCVALLCLGSRILAERFDTGRPDMLFAQEPYSTDLATAWGVAEKCGAFDLGMDTRPHRGPLYCRFNGGAAYAEAETAPLAICLAALQAMGYAEAV